jgi:uncharacterized protein YyaL (SSP411 family)
LVILPSAKKPADSRGAAVSWLSLDEVAKRLESDKKPVLIDLYTSWCGWCKVMDKKTYSNKAVAAYLNDKFYTVRVDAESRATIQWQGRSYGYNSQYRCNDFALYLAHGQLEFPTTVIIPPGEAPQAIPGYIEPKDFEPLVKFFGEGAWRTRDFGEYHKNFHPTW